jgi:hypothetical protein
MINLKFLDSTTKSIYFAFTCAQVLISVRCHTNPFELFFFACHYYNSDIVANLYICFSHGIMEKWHTTFMGTWVLPTYLYLALPHFGQWVCPTYWPLYKTHSKIQTWILLYSKPIHWHRVFAPYMLLSINNYMHAIWIYVAMKKIHLQICLNTHVPCTYLLKTL